MERQPLISVLCLSMNHEAFVRQGYSSLVQQTYRNIEILYLDNNSRDNSFKIADEIFRQSGLPYQGFESKTPRGISANLNFLLQKAKGEFVALLSAGDWWEEDHLQGKIDVFTKNPEYGLVYGNAYFYFEKEKKQHIVYNEEQLSGDVFRKLLNGNFIIGPSVIMNMKAIKELGFYDEKSPIEDWELWLRIAQKYKFGYVHKPSVYYRVSSNNLSSNISFMNDGFEYIFAKYPAYPEIKIARKNIKKGQAYQLASTRPGFKSLGYILRNYQFSLGYTKHVIRCLLGMIGWKDKKHLNQQL